MLEKVCSYSNENTKIIEKTIDDEPVMINHMLLPKGEGLPEHFANSNVYMIVVRGTVTLQLDEQEVHEYAHGQIVNIPYHTKMNVNNTGDDLLELFVVKSPNPRNYKEAV